MKNIIVAANAAKCFDLSNNYTGVEVVICALSLRKARRLMESSHVIYVGMKEEDAIRFEKGITGALLPWREILPENREYELRSDFQCISAEMQGGKIITYRFEKPSEENPKKK